jgi:hypothetical protein
MSEKLFNTYLVRLTTVGCFFSVDKIPRVPTSFGRDKPEKIWVGFGYDLGQILAKRKAYEALFPIYNRGEALKN